MNTRIKTISVLLIMLAIISPPFVFAELEFFGKEMRGLIGLTVIILLCLENTKLKISELLIFSFLVFVILMEFLSKRSDLNNVLSAYAVIFVAFLIFRILIVLLIMIISFVSLIKSLSHLSNLIVRL